MNAKSPAKKNVLFRDEGNDHEDTRNASKEFRRRPTGKPNRNWQAEDEDEDEEASF